MGIGFFFGILFGILFGNSYGNSFRFEFLCSLGFVIVQVLVIFEKFDLMRRQRQNRSLEAQGWRFLGLKDKVSRKNLEICDHRIHEKTWWARYSVSNWGTPKPFSLPKPSRSGCQKPCWTSPPTSPLLCALMDTHSCMCAHFTPKPQLKREWGFWLLMLIHAIWFNKGKILSSQFVDLMDKCVT